MIDRTVIEPLGDQALNCVCGRAPNWEWLASLMHGWPLMFTVVAAVAFVVLGVLLVAPAIQRNRDHRGHVDTYPERKS